MLYPDSGPTITASAKELVAVCMAHHHDQEVEDKIIEQAKEAALQLRPAATFFRLPTGEVHWRMMQ